VKKERGRSPVEIAGRNPIRSLLAFGSETPDNLNMAERVHWRRFRDERMTGSPWKVGFVVAGIPLSELVHRYEDAPVPVALRRRFPALTKEDWDAARRVVTLLLSPCNRLESSHREGERRSRRSRSP
jgi:hypothetical protein